MLLLLTDRAGAKVELRDVQAAQGPLGVERKSAEYVAGDEVFYRFAIAGAQTDSNGRLRGELRLTLADANGKVLDKTENAIQQLPALGSESFAARASWSLGLGFAPGEYEVTVEFADLIAKESASFRRKFTVKAVEFALVRVRFHHDLEERVPARPGGTVGQNLAIKFNAIGFDRSNPRRVTSRSGLYRPAAEDLDAATPLVSADLLPVLGVDKGSLLVSAGEVLKGVAEVQKALATSGVSSECRFDGARVYARAAKATADAEVAEGLVREAVAELIIAEKGGYFRSTERATLLATHADFAALRSQEEFKTLVARAAHP